VAVESYINIDGVLSGDSLSNESSDLFWDEFIALVERHGLLFGGCHTMPMTEKELDAYQTKHDAYLAKEWIREKLLGDP